MDWFCCCRCRRNTDRNNPTENTASAPIPAINHILPSYSAYPLLFREPFRCWNLKKNNPPAVRDYFPVPFESIRTIGWIDCGGVVIRLLNNRGKRIIHILLPGNSFIFAFCSSCGYDGRVSKWCTVTVIDKNGQRHSLDVRAESSFDAAHLYLTTAKAQPQALKSTPLPIPDLTTRFEVITEGKVLFVEASALPCWIRKRREELTGPKKVAFSQRPPLA